MANNQTLSEAGVKFMTQPRFDSFEPMPYLDPGGLWTIGFGTRITDKQMQEFKEGITEEHARQMFQDHTHMLTAQLRSCPLALLQHQFDACCSLAYNIGLPAFLGSTVYKQLAVRSIDLSSWLWFVKDAKGKVQSGLVNRRRAELKLFIYGLYS